MLIPTTITCPAWLPQTVRDILAGQPVSFALPKAVKLILRSPEKIQGAEWAGKYRVVTDGAHQGPWRHEYAPHTVKIMDTFTLPHVREVWFCGVEQSGKTNTMLNCLGWCVDCDPGNIFYLMPTEDTADKITGGKLKPTLVRSPRLARYLSSRQDDTSLARINLSHGVTIFPAHANSASSLATWSAKHCFGDEVDKYPAMVGKEADPITLLKKRNRTYRGRYKRFFSSTPAGMYIYKGMRSCHQVWEYRVRCGHCREKIRMDAEHLVLPEDATPESVEQEALGYACAACGVVWDDAGRRAAIRSGGWVCVKGEDLPRPAKVGFHHRAWECLDISLAEIAGAWLRAKTGDHAARIAWANGYEAENYTPDTRERNEDYILRLRDSRPVALVPVWCDFLEISIDTQDKGFWYRIRAWEFGTLTSALIRHGFVDSAAALDTVIYQSAYADSQGRQHRIGFGIIDSGGHRTAEVYQWCRRPGSVVLPSKGASGRKSRAISMSQQDTWPGTNKPIPGGLKLYIIDTHFHKDALAARLAIEPHDPGCFWLHSGHTAEQLAETERRPDQRLPHGLEDYARQMCSEYRDERGLWQLVGDENSKRANHLWDCEVGGLALVLYLGLQHRTRDVPQGKKPSKAQPVNPYTGGRNPFGAERRA